MKGKVSACKLSDIKCIVHEPGNKEQLLALLGACCLLWVVAIAAILPYIALNKDNTPSTKCFQYKQLHNAKWKGYFNLVLVVAFWVVYGALVDRKSVV